MKDKILEAVQISKTYGEGESAVHALRNSDLTLENGTFASIIGSSGSGKSTLLKILGGLLPPTTGKVLLDGQDIYAMNAEQLAQVRRQKIGFIFQDFRLFPEYTVRDNILIPFYLDHRAPDEQMLRNCLPNNTFSFLLIFGSGTFCARFACCAIIIKRFFRLFN